EEFGVSCDRHPVRWSLPAFFRSGSASKGRLALSCPNTVAGGRTAGKRGSDLNRLAQLGRATAENRVSRVRFPCLVTSKNWSVETTTSGTSVPHRGDPAIRGPCADRGTSGAVRRA